MHNLDSSFCQYNEKRQNNKINVIVEHKLCAMNDNLLSVQNMNKHSKYALCTKIC